jgi:hypothetical protein
MATPRLLSWDAYSAAPPRPPLRLVWRAPTGGVLVYLGVSHTFAPDDPQLELISADFTSLRPHVVLNEGGDPPPLKARRATVERHGEAGLLAWLAQRHGVARRTLEPDVRAETATMTGRFASLDVKLFFLLRDGLSARRAGLPGGPDRVLAVLLDNLRRKRGLLGPPDSAAEVRAAMRARLPHAPPWHEVPDAWLDPALTPARSGGPGWLHDISRASSRLRDRWMARFVAGVAAPGRRVLAVVGHTHVAVQRPLFEALVERRGGTLRFEERLQPGERWVP